MNVHIGLCRGGMVESPYARGDLCEVLFDKILAGPVETLLNRLQHFVLSQGLLIVL